MAEQNEEKRKGGQITEKDGKPIWLVLSESTGEKGKGYKHSCGESIVGATVAHSIHDGPFPLSGSGRVYNETVPYCPKCEIAPNSHGRPLEEDPRDIQEREILRRISDGK